tara:strand:+ start:21132 stop:21698 length:567 start_codon:yes stop_codon:yes gene_type:complete
MNPFEQAWAVLKGPQPKLKYNLPLTIPPWMKRGAGKPWPGRVHQQSQSIAQGTSPSDEGAIVPPGTRHTQLSGGKHYSSPLDDYEGQITPNPTTDELDDARNQAFAKVKADGIALGLVGDDLEEYISTNIQPLIGKMFLKGRMSDIHIGFQEDPQKELAQLLHQGLSKDQAMALYQQYVNSLGDTGRV